MKIYLKETVLDAARKRVATLFDEFQNLYVAFSGGKDSTVVLNLALEEAERRGRLPLPVIFIDQEAEWQATIDYVTDVMEDPRVKPIWLQCPIRISNSASIEDVWLWCWKEGEEWMHPKVDYSYHENVFGTDRFKEMFDHVLAYFHPDEKAALMGGVRAEESPARRHALTSNAKYKGITWAKKLKAGRGHPHFAFYPIYDWSYTDVWKFIHDGGHAYCKIYDYMFQHGVPVWDMRVSNLHHETAVKSLYYMQEIEQETWAKMTARLGGVHVARNLDLKTMFQAPKKLPWMFKSWPEYRDYLLDKLIENQEHKNIYRKAFAAHDKIFSDMRQPERLYKVEVSTILANDFHLTKLDNFAKSTPQAGEFRKFKSGHPIKRKYAQWLTDEQLSQATFNEVN